MEELKAFKAEQSMKIGYLEHKLVRNTILCLLNIAIFLFLYLIFSAEPSEKPLIACIKDAFSHHWY